MISLRPPVNGGEKERKREREREKELVLYKKQANRSTEQGLVGKVD